MEAIIWLVSGIFHSIFAITFMCIFQLGEEDDKDNSKDKQ